MKSFLAVHFANSVAFFASAVPVNAGQSVKIAMRRGTATMTWLQKPTFIFFKAEAAVHKALIQVEALSRDNKRPIGNMMRKKSELVACTDSWLCVVVHV